MDASRNAGGNEGRRCVSSHGRNTTEGMFAIDCSASPTQHHTVLGHMSGDSSSPWYKSGLNRR